MSYSGYAKNLTDVLQKDEKNNRPFCYVKDEFLGYTSRAYGENMLQPYIDGNTQ